MGAWGYGLFDNDGAADFKEDLLGGSGDVNYVKREIASMLREKNPHALASILVLLPEMGEAKYDKLFATNLPKLVKLHAQKGAYDEWEEGRSKAKAAVTRALTKMKKAPAKKKAPAEKRAPAKKRAARKPRKTTTRSSDVDPDMFRKTTKQLVVAAKRGNAKARKELSRRGRGLDGRKK